MSILNQKRILNLIPKVSAPVTIHVSQGDVGTEIEFTLVKGDEVFVNPGNVSASVHGVREDRANFGPFTCTLSGSKVTFPLHSEMTAVKGSAIAEVVLVDNGGNKVGSSNFGIMVEESVFPLGVTYDNDVSVYESILAYVQTIPAQVEADITMAVAQETQAREASIAALYSALEQEASTRAVNDGNETVSRTNDVSNLQSQIDQLIAPSGEAPSEAEVQNARIGADNVTYDTLGNAIRNQVKNIVDTENNNTEDVILKTKPFYRKVNINNTNIGTAAVAPYYEMGTDIVPPNDEIIVSTKALGLDNDSVYAGIFIRVYEFDSSNTRLKTNEYKASDANSIKYIKLQTTTAYIKVGYVISKPATSESVKDRILFICNIYSLPLIFNDNITIPQLDKWIGWVRADDLADANDAPLNKFMNIPVNSAMLHLPDVSRNARMYLFTYGDSTMKHQEYWNTTTGDIYARRFHDGGWDEWMDMGHKQAIADCLNFSKIHHNILDDTTKTLAQSRQSVSYAAIRVGEYDVAENTKYIVNLRYQHLLNVNLFEEKHWIRVYYFNSNNEQISSQEAPGEIMALILPSGAAKMRVCAMSNLKTTPSSAVDYQIAYHLIMQAFDNKITEQKNINLKVGSFNVGLYDCGRSRTSDERMYTSEKDLAVREFVGANNFDILACQENPWIGLPNDKNTRTSFTLGFGWFYAGTFTLTISSKYPIVSTETGTFTNKYEDDGRGWQIVEMIINGKIVAIANCHPAWQQDASAIRELQEQELIDMLSDYEYAIIFGDFNANSTSEFEIFTNNGYVLSNGGYLPFVNTAPSYGEATKALDNIIVKAPTKAISFREVLEPVVANVDEEPEDVLDTYVSDHLPIIANITLI